MKRVLIIIAVMAASMTVNAQRINRPETIIKTELGNQRLVVMDSVFTLVLKSSVKPISIVLGKKEEALRILRFLRDADVHRGDIIELENEAGDVCKYNGLMQYEFFSQGRQFTGQMAKRYVKKYVEAVEQYGSQ